MISALSFVRLFSDAEGESHFAPLQIGMETRNFAPPAPSFDVSALMPASSCAFLRVPEGWVGELHPSPMRMWIFFLAGEMEFESSDGERRPGRPGNAILLEDTKGKGHLSRVVGNSDAILAAVQL